MSIRAHDSLSILWEKIKEQTTCDPQGKLKSDTNIKLQHLMQDYEFNPTTRRDDSKIDSLIKKIQVSVDDDKETIATKLLQAFYTNIASVNQTIPLSAQNAILTRMKITPIKGLNHELVLGAFTYHLREDREGKCNDPNIYALILTGMMSDHPEIFLSQLSKFDFFPLIRVEKFIQYCIKHFSSMNVRPDRVDLVEVSKWMCIFPVELDVLVEAASKQVVEDKTFIAFKILFRGIFGLCSEAQQSKILGGLGGRLQQAFKSELYAYHYMPQSKLTELICTHYIEHHFGRVSSDLLSTWIRGLGAEDFEEVYHNFRTGQTFCKFFLEDLPKPFPDIVIAKVGCMHEGLQLQIAEDYIKEASLPPISIVGSQGYGVALITYMETHLPSEIYAWAKTQHVADFYQWIESVPSLEGLAKAMPTKCIALFEGVRGSYEQQIRLYDRTGSTKDELIALRAQCFSSRSTYGTFDEIDLEKLDFFQNSL